MIKNAFPNKSENPETLKASKEKKRKEKRKKLLQLESSSTNMHIVSEDLLRAFDKLFC